MDAWSCRSAALRVIVIAVIWQLVLGVLEMSIHNSVCWNLSQRILYVFSETSFAVAKNYKHTSVQQ